MWVFVFQKYGKTISLGHFIKHKVHISEEWTHEDKILFIYGLISFSRCINKKFKIVLFYNQFQIDKQTADIDIGFLFVKSIS